MARTPSTMLPLGTIAPDFRLPEPATGRTVALSELGPAPAYLVVFMCNHCPFVQHVIEPLTELIRQYQQRGVVAVAINANDAEAYPDDSPENMAAEARRRGFTFPYLYDADQSVAQAYQAACTPDFYVFDGDRRLVYRGQMDDSRPGNGIPVTGKDLRAALDAVLAGETPSTEQKPSLGCNIKWKPGRAPSYA